MLRDLANGLLLTGRGDLRRANLLVLQIAHAKSSGPGQEQIEHRPTHTQAAGLSGEAADHFRPPPHFLQRTLQQIRGPEPLAQAWEVVQMDAQGRQVLGEAGRRCARAASERNAMDTSAVEAAESIGAGAAWAVVRPNSSPVSRSCVAPPNSANSHARAEEFRVFTSAVPSLGCALQLVARFPAGAANPATVHRRT